MKSAGIPTCGFFYTLSSGMIKNLFLIALSFLLSSCFYPFVEGMMSYYEDAERMLVYGILDGPLKFTEKYVLEYSINGKEQEDISYSQRDSNYKETWSGNLKFYAASYCNVSLPGGDIFPCRRRLSDVADVEIYIKRKSGGGRQLLAKKTVDIREFHRSVLLTQIHFGSDKELYKTRSRFNFEWDRSEPIILDATNDTIYHYTVWYWDKMQEHEMNNPIEDDYLVEIPSGFSSKK